MKSFNHFDYLASLYDRLIKPSDPTKIGFLANLPISSGLLDVGGGTGRSAYELRHMVAGVTIIDSSMGMLRQAMGKKAFMIVCSNSESLPFPDQSFERVIMVDALHHVENYRETLSELWRVLKVGGRIVIEEPDIRTIAVKIMAIVEKVALMRSHLISPLIIRDFFDFPGAFVKIEKNNSTAWVIIDKSR